MKSLHDLNFTQTVIADEDCRHIAELPNLATIYLGKTWLTLDGLAAVQRASPNLIIQFSDDGCVGLHLGGDGHLK